MLYLKRIIKLRNKKAALSEFLNRNKMAKRNKVFCIGRNKTGTTSITRLFKEVGLKIGRQRLAEKQLVNWSEGNFKDIINYVKYKGEAFQDIPFSLPGTFKVMDENFPNSKFILTVRDSPEVWYTSLTSFHSKLFGNGQVPSKQDLQSATYVRKGWLWDANRLIYRTPENDIYSENILKQHYDDYNNSVIDYFKNMPEKFLLINLKDPDAAQKICRFLNSNIVLDKMPWENKTRN